MRSLLRELKFSIVKIRIVKALLGASVVFLSVYAFLLLINVPILPIALALGVFFFISEMLFFSKIKPLKLIEQNYSDLNEELSTVEDTLGKEGELVDDLRKEVQEKVKKQVDVADFVNFKKLFSRSFFVIFLALFVVVIASLNLKIVDGADILVGAQGLLDKLDQARQNEQVNVAASDSALKNRFKKIATSAGLTASDQDGGELFGTSKVASLGEGSYDVEVRPTDFDVSLTDYEEAKNLNFIERDFYGSAEASKSSSFEEEIPQEEQALVKKYFETISAIGG